MSYNKKAHLRANIEAIKLVFKHEKENLSASEDQKEILRQYSGFGGLKCVLNPANNLMDTVSWPKSELELFPLVAELHRTIRENTATEQEYKDYMGSIKNSILTAFYTPSEVVQTISDIFKENEIPITHLLDPSAGMGEFSNAFDLPRDSEKISFEKDLITGKILSYVNDKNNEHTYIEGFETIESRYNNYFDVVSSNIPFGEMSVFDAGFMKTDRLHRDSTRAIHNYFFIKGVETLREGGILAFITSQGVLNSSNNKEVRQWLMDNTNLISAIRLPNNLFVENAGTEVGSDLIILQKNTQKQNLTAREKKFLTTYNLSTGITINSSFENLHRIIHTKGYNDTDPYGKPAQVFIHEGGMEGISSDLKKMLKADFSTHLNLDLYLQHSGQSQRSRNNTPTSAINQKIKDDPKVIELDTSQP